MSTVAHPVAEEPPGELAALTARLEAADERLLTLGAIQAQLAEAEETPRAIRHGEIDVLVASEGQPGQ